MRKHIGILLLITVVFRLGTLNLKANKQSIFQPSCWPHASMLFATQFLVQVSCARKICLFTCVLFFHLQFYIPFWSIWQPPLFILFGIFDDSKLWAHLHSPNTIVFWDLNFKTLCPSNSNTSFLIFFLYTERKNHIFYVWTFLKIVIVITFWQKSKIWILIFLIKIHAFNHCDVWCCRVFDSETCFPSRHLKLTTVQIIQTKLRHMISCIVRMNVTRSLPIGDSFTYR